MNSNKDLLVIKRKKITKGGVYGHFVPLDKNCGVKILHGKFDSYKLARNSANYFSAKIEEFTMKSVKERFKFVPKCFGVKIIKFNEYFRVGIVMQNLGDMTLSKYVENNDVPDDFEGKIDRVVDSALRKVKIIHDDIHSGNIIYYKNNWWVIDFGGNEEGVVRLRNKK